MSKGSLRSKRTSSLLWSSKVQLNKTASLFKLDQNSAMMFEVRVSLIQNSTGVLLFLSVQVQLFQNAPLGLLSLFQKIQSSEVSDVWSLSWTTRSRTVQTRLRVHTWLLPGQVWIQGLFNPFQPRFLSFEDRHENDLVFLFLFKIFLKPQDLLLKRSQVLRCVRRAELFCQSVN